MLQRLGFIGTGTITEAIIEGLAKSPAHPSPTHPGEIVVSPRNAEIAARLAERHPFVRVAADNQAVLDCCDVVCLAVRPQIAAEVLAELRFAERHHVLSFIATLRHDRLAGLLSNRPKTITRLAPLPMVAEQLGTTIVYPNDPLAAKLFNQLGTAIEIDVEEAFDVLFSATALMGSFFATLQKQSDWLTEHGIEPPVARAFLSALFWGLSNTAKHSHATFGELSTEYSTRGGLNEQITRELGEHGAFDAYSAALGGVLKRIQNR